MSRFREWFVAGTCLSAILAIWSVDRLASENFRFGFVYILPLAVGAWWGTRRVALICAAAASAALVVNDLALQPAPTLIANVWNEFTRATTFVAIVLLISRLRDSSARVRAEAERLFRLAVTDQLTGLYNRRYLMEELQRVHSATARSGRPYALLSMDLDGFKRINDTFGHSAGDAALVAFATELTDSIRAGDIAVRMGGDEFLVLLPDAHAAEAAALGERILRRLGESTDRLRVHSVSAGVTSWRPQATPEALVAEADRLIYDSKRRGGGRVTAVLAATHEDQ